MKPSPKWSKNRSLTEQLGGIFKKYAEMRFAITEKDIQMLDLWRSENIEIVDCYLIACLEKDKQNILYSYDLDFDKYDIQRIEP